MRSLLHGLTFGKREDVSIAEDSRQLRGAFYGPRVVRWKYKHLELERGDVLPFLWGSKGKRTPRPTREKKLANTYASASLF